ncbi:MAG: ParB/RepB/Spo0J family partition protein [Planctomycetes bacterium]|nr:ParB/RepB/Spo0J family partition protein [Planctomycetota bacterium]
MDEQTPATVEFPQNPQQNPNPSAEGTGLPKRRLGRGLGSLLGGLGEPAILEESHPAVEAPVGEFGEIEEALISRNPYQPRKDFAEEELAELAESISQHGILQPLLVRAHEGAYQLIAGERRLLAARKAGLARVPCRVVVLDDKQVCEVAIVENVQRADLNDLEKAQAFQNYLDKFGGTIEELSAKLGKNRSTVSNFLRLLELPDQVKIALSAGKISAGHARALLPLEEESHQIAMCKRIEAEKLSVRQVEDEVRDKLLSSDGATVPFHGAEGKGKPAKGKRPSNHILELQQQLRELLGVKVEIRMKGKDSGKLIIPFGSNNDFERIAGHLKKVA